MKKIILTIVSFALLTAFTNKPTIEKQVDGYYYFAYSSLDQYSNHIYITPLLYIENCSLSDAGISNQFHDYMKAEYKGIIYKCEGKRYSVDFNTTKSKAKAELQKTRRKIMSYAKKITKITDFEYLCDD